MSIGSMNPWMGANTTLDRGATGSANSLPPKPLTVQEAVAQPLTTPQSAVTQSPATGQTGWKQDVDPDGRQKGVQSNAKPDPQVLSSAVNRINQHLNKYNTSLQFQMDDVHNQVVIRVVDQETHEVVRQIPSETALALAQFFDEVTAGRSRQVGSAVNSSDNTQLSAAGAEGFLLKTVV